LGDVLRAAHSRLVVVCDAPVAPDSKAAQTILSKTVGPDDAQAAQLLGALIYRTSEAGTISLSGGPDGWTLGT
jgi:hypothetical protein